jgi:hypothetical protein
VAAWTAAHERDWKPLTKVGRDSLYRIYIGPAMGERRVSELLSDREHLRALYRGVSPAQARNIHGVLRGAFRWAVGEEMIERDPTDLAKPPPYRKPEARYLDLDDVRRLRQLVAGHGLEGAVTLEPGRPAPRRGDLCAMGRPGRQRPARPRLLMGRQNQDGAEAVAPLSAGEVAALRAFRAREAERLLRVGLRIDDRTTILTDGFGEPLRP